MNNSVNIDLLYSRQRAITLSTDVSKLFNGML